MKTPVLVIGAMALVAAFSVPAAAQISITPYIGYTLNAGFDTEFDDFDSDSEAQTEGAFTIGLALDVPFTTTGTMRLGFRPSFEYLFLSGVSESFTENGFSFEFSLDQSRYQINGDVVAEFLNMGNVRPFVGAGVAFVSYSATFEVTGNFNGEQFSESDSASETAVGLNLLGGAVFGTGRIAPMVLARFTLADPTPDEFEDESLGNAFSIQAGVRINL